jgi:hypothetical protein
MGMVGDALKSAVSNSYDAVFKFRAELGKGLIVEESSIPVYAIRALGAPRAVNIRNTDNQEIILEVVQARQFKNIALLLDMDSAAVRPVIQKAVRELNDLYTLKRSFYVAIGITNKKNGEIAEAYVLRDKFASLSGSHLPTADTIEGTWPIFLKFKAPELMHGLGNIYKHGLQKV